MKLVLARGARGALASLWCVASSFVGACALVQPVSGEVGEPALLQVDCVPPDAELLVDDAPMGELTRWREATVPIRAGARRVELRRDGYLPWRLDLDAQAGRLYRLQLDLVRDPAALDALLADEPASPQEEPAEP